MGLTEYSTLIRERSRVGKAGLPDELVRNEHIKVRPYQHTIDTLQSLSEETGVPVAVIAMYLIDSNVGELLNEIDRAAVEQG